MYKITHHFSKVIFIDKKKWISFYVYTTAQYSLFNLTYLIQVLIYII